MTSHSYESWPGEYLLWKGDNGERRPAVLQTFDPDNRIADILFIDTPPPFTDRQTVSVLELDPGGPGKAPYGVGIGQVVLLTPDNLVPIPEVGILGQPPEAVAEHVAAEMSRFMIRMLAQRFPDAEIALPAGDLSKITWYGEVTALHLDGMITVTLPSGAERTVGLKNIVLLNDGMDPDAMLDPQDGMDLDGDSFYDDEMSDRSWETMSGDEVVVDEEDVEMADDEEESEPHVSVVEEEDEDAKDEQSIEEMYPPEDEGTSGPASSPVAGPSTLANTHASRTSLADDEGWVRFEMLEEAPQDHHFVSEPRTSSPGKAFLSRLNKEHKALMSSLPGGSG